MKNLNNFPVSSSAYEEFGARSIFYVTQIIFLDTFEGDLCHNK